MHRFCIAGCRLTRGRRSALPSPSKFRPTSTPGAALRRPAAGDCPNGTAWPGCFGCRCWRRFPHLRTSDRIARDYRHVFVAVVCPGMLAAVPDIGASDQRPRQPAFVNLTLAEGLGPISPPRMPKVASWQLLLRTPDRPMFTLARSRRKRSALSVSVARAVACVPAKAVTKKIFATSNQSVTADDLVNLRLILNFLPRGPNRST
jgi:hypothetical protein